MFLKPFMSIFSHYFTHAARAIKQTVFPSVCLLCLSRTNTEKRLCEPCINELPILTQACMQCAEILPSNINVLICGRCQKTSPAFDRTYALFTYEAPIPQMIIALKFKHDLSFAAAMAELLLTRIVNTWYQHQPYPDLILPVPLHAKRLRERGFNQAIEIARPLAKALHLPLDYKNIYRIKQTKAQSELSAKERQANMKRAFSCDKQFHGLHLAVVDDVMTTGETVHALSSLLKKRGAKTIDIWCFARRTSTSSRI